MCACVGACVLCGNVGSARSPRAMLINALQTKCSPFSLLLSPPLLPSSAQLQPSEWPLPREKEEVVLGRQLEGSTRIKQNTRGSTLVGFRQCRALPLSPSCLFCLMLRPINKLNSELRLRLSHTSHANHVNNSPTFPIFSRNTGPLPKTPGYLN